MEIFIASLVAFVAIMALSSWRIEPRFRTSKVGYLLSDRDVSTFQLSMSIAASWTYVFGLIMLGAMAFTKGTAGVFWFVVAPVTCMLILAAIGFYLLKKFPQGFTLSEFVRERFKDKRITVGFYLVMLVGVINALVGNLTGFGLVAEYISGDKSSYNAIVLVLAGTVLAYSLWGGLKSSVRTDTVQMALILLAVAVVGGALWSTVGSPIAVMASVDQIVKTSIFDPVIMTNMGLIYFMILLGSSINDNGLYQRMYAANGDSRKIRNAFIIGGAVFAIGLIGFGVMGAGAAALKLEIANPKLANTMVAEHLLGSMGLLLVALAMLAAAASTMDTALNSIGSVVSNEFFPDRDPVKVSRITQISLVVIATVAALFKFDIWAIFFTLGIIRLITVAPILFAIFSNRDIRTGGLALGMLLALILAVAIKFNWVTMTPLWSNLSVLLIPALAILLSLKPKTNLTSV